jgi:transcriptional regulator with XRE-family HTH domain
MTNLIEGKYPVRRERVASLMKDQGWTVSSLARAADISESSIKRLFSGEDLRMSTIAPLAEQLGVKPSALIVEPDNQINTEIDAVGVSNDFPLSPPSADSQVGPPADAPQEKKEKVCFRFSFEIDVPFASFREREQVPVLLAEIGRQIHQMGALVIASAQPGSVRIICWATDKSDVDRFISAVAEDKLASLRIMNPQVLDHLADPEDDDTHVSDHRASTTVSDSPVPASPANIERQSKSEAIESIAPPDKPINSSPMTDEEKDRFKAAVAGAAAGAAIGSVIPVIGTAIGGIIGGVFGGLFMKNRQKK